VDAAQGQLDLLRRGGSPAAKSSAPVSVDLGQSAVAATQARLDAVKNGGIDAQRARSVRASARTQASPAGGLSVALGRPFWAARHAGRRYRRLNGARRAWVAANGRPGRVNGLTGAEPWRLASRRGAEDQLTLGRHPPRRCPTARLRSCVCAHRRRAAGMRGAITESELAPWRCAESELLRFGGFDAALRCLDPAWACAIWAWVGLLP